MGQRAPQSTPTGPHQCNSRLRIDGIARTYPLLAGAGSPYGDCVRGDSSASVVRPLAMSATCRALHLGRGSARVEQRLCGTGRRRPTAHFCSAALSSFDGDPLRPS